jgi:hypothetical protein
VLSFARPSAVIVTARHSWRAPLDKNYKAELQVKAGKLWQIAAMYEEIAHRLEDHAINSPDVNLSATEAAEDFISLVYDVVGSNNWSHDELMRLWANALTVTLVLQDETEKAAPHGDGVSSRIEMTHSHHERVSGRHRERHSESRTY